MSEEILSGLRQAVTDYDPDAAESWANRALAAGLQPTVALDALTQAIREIGEGFERGDLFLPDLVAAAEAMSGATRVLEAAIAEGGPRQASAGSIVIGTVKGDIHDIGKNMVAVLLRAAGFQVHDLGVNVPPEAFVAAVQRHGADVLAMSALLTTTAPEQRKVIEQLRELGLRDRIKVMVGGGGLTRDFATSIGADGYEPTAPGAVRLAQRLLLRD